MTGPTREAVEQRLKHYAKSVAAIARIQPTWTLTTVLDDIEAQKLTAALIAFVAPVPVERGEVTGEDIAWLTKAANGEFVDGIPVAPVF